MATQSTPNTFLVQVLIFGSSVAHPAAVEQEDALHRRRFCRLPDSMDFLHFASACSLLLFMWISLSVDVCQSVEGSFMRRLGSQSRVIGPYLRHDGLDEVGVGVGVFCMVHVPETSPTLSGFTSCLVLFLAVAAHLKNAAPESLELYSSSLTSYCFFVPDDPTSSPDCEPMRASHRPFRLPPVNARPLAPITKHSPR